MSKQVPQTNRSLAVATRVSALALGVTTILLAASWWLNPKDHRLSFDDRAYLGVHRARLVVFNNAEHGPYRGSVFAIVADNGDTNPRLTETAFGDAAGVYYRRFEWTDSGKTLWTLMINLWYPMALFAVLPARSAFRLVRSGGRSCSTTEI